MYEIDYVVQIIKCGTQLQREMATHNPDKQTIITLLQNLQDASNGLYKWARGIEDDNGQT